MHGSDHSIDRIARECLAVRMRLLNRVITKIYDDALRPHGLKISQSNILAVAGKLGLANPLRICEILHLDKSTLSRNVERMEAKGWLEVVPGDDAREQPFRITGQGKALMKRAEPAWEKAQAQAGKLLGKEGVAFLKKAAVGLGMPELA
jgi:DNA-binding MarR family transcriptional regulator